MNDRQLSANFWLHEFPGWQNATEGQVSNVQETAARVLQPIRAQFGPVDITSWIAWSDGEPRTGSHGQLGGTIDFVPRLASPREVWQWGAVHLAPAGYIGRWIYEPEILPGGGLPQGEHIHMATRADMIRLNGDGRIQVLEELPDGTGYVLKMSYPEPFLPPVINIPGLEVTVSPIGLLGFLGSLVLFITLARRAQPAT